MAPAHKNSGNYMQNTNSNKVHARKIQAIFIIGVSGVRRHSGLTTH